MKATEKCSCGASFEAEGRGARAALIEWRQTHQHTVAPAYDWFRYPGITQPSYPYYPTITYSTGTRTPMGNVCEVPA